ncbi:MAG: HepT-like ribonuclease domain-containing protein [Pseudomonadota bacterium]
MYDKELAIEILNQILQASLTVISRFERVSGVSDFTDTPAGIEKMDSVCMQLIVIGEAIKKLDKITDGSLLSTYQEVDWRKAAGMRDILTHHYADIDPNAVFYTCRDKIPVLSKTIRRIIDGIS